MNDDGPTCWAWSDRCTAGRSRSANRRYRATGSYRTHADDRGVDEATVGVVPGELAGGNGRSLRSGDVIPGKVPVQ